MWRTGAALELAGDGLSQLRGGGLASHVRRVETARQHSLHRAQHLTCAAKVTTPLLIQHGENDRRVPIMQAHKFYKALKKMGKTVEMEIFPRGGHVLSEPAQQREIMRRNLEWFRRWLNP